MSSATIDFVLADLKQRFGAKVLLSPADIAPLIAMSENAQASLRCRNRFPLPVLKRGRRVGVSIHHLAEYLATGTVAATTPAPAPVPPAPQAAVVSPPTARRRRTGKPDYSWLMRFADQTAQQHRFESELLQELSRLCLAAQPTPTPEPKPKRRRAPVAL